MAWATSGPQTNPPDGTVLADSGAIGNGGGFKVTVVFSATVLTVARVEHRDAANATTLHSQIIVCAANATVNPPFGEQQLGPGERVRIVTVGAVAGSVQASLTTG